MTVMVQCTCKLIAKNLITTIQVILLLPAPISPELLSLNLSHHPTITAISWPPP